MLEIINYSFSKFYSSFHHFSMNTNHSFITPIIQGFTSTPKYQWQTDNGSEYSTKNALHPPTQKTPTTTSSPAHLFSPAVVTDYSFLLFWEFVNPCKSYQREHLQFRYAEERKNKHLFENSSTTNVYLLLESVHIYVLASNESIPLVSSIKYYKTMLSFM